MRTQIGLTYPHVRSLFLIFHKPNGSCKYYILESLFIGNEWIKLGSLHNFVPLTKFPSPYLGLAFIFPSSICQLHQLVDHNGIYSIQRRKAKEVFNLALWLGNLHKVILVAPFVLQRKYGCQGLKICLLRLV